MMDDLESRIFKLASQVLVKRFEGMMKVSECLAEPNPAEVDALGSPTDHRSEIFIFGTDLTLRLQLFFNMEVYQKRLTHLYPNGATTTQIHDFFNELANMTCGKMKEQMVSQGINAAISLPISVESPGIKQQLLSETLPRVQNFFIIHSKSIEFISRASMAIHCRHSFEKFDATFSEDSSSEGDVEFL